MNGNAMLKPALMGGLVAAYLLQSNTPQPIALGDGALVGLLAGLFGAVVNMIVSVPMNILTGPFQQRLFQRIAESQPDLPDNVRQMVDNMGMGAMSIAGTIMAFFMMLVLGAVFSSLGGLLGAFFFKKKALPAPPPPPFTAGPSGPYIDVQ